MIKAGMYVRYPNDKDKEAPRNFVIGKVVCYDSFTNYMDIEFYDIIGISQYYDKPINIKTNYPCAHCKIRVGAKVQYNDITDLIVKYGELSKEDEFFYYLIEDKNCKTYYVSEKDIVVSYNESYIYPIKQLSNYEFQNPKWYLGRTMVSMAMSTINNCLYGFKDLAGCKISLKSYQMETIMKCLEEENCRKMIADEVGLGKTIEAICVLKIYLLEHQGTNVLILVPNSLVEQWKTELAFKFKLFVGDNANNNTISLYGINDYKKTYGKKFDFIIVDEVHRFTADEATYNYLLELSKKSKNIIMLSATPLQNRYVEYFKLLKLINPLKFENYEYDKFKNLVDKQTSLLRVVCDVYDNYESLKDLLNDTKEIELEEVGELYELVIKGLNKIGYIINDKWYSTVLKKIKSEDGNIDQETIQIAIAYVCENYQLDKNIIRNRRKMIQNENEDLKNERKLIDLSYDIEDEENESQYVAYSRLVTWLENEPHNNINYEKNIIPVITSFFSSASSYYAAVNDLNDKINLPSEILDSAEKYVGQETAFVNSLNDDTLLNINEKTKLANIINFLLDLPKSKKAILFTDFSETFDVYANILSKIFKSNEYAFFRKDLNQVILESNAYKFQNIPSCRFLLSDMTGGEGRNFQNADIIIHIDIPWKILDIEQRIGRLDRIGREVNKSIISVVLYAKSSIEEEIFDILNSKLKLFVQSQSGLEIIMPELDNIIISSLKSSFKEGLGSAEKEISEIIEKQAKELKKEQVFDVASYQYELLIKKVKENLLNYEKKEKKLFRESMLNWAYLAGFKATERNNDYVTFSEESMSYASLENVLLLPPNMKAIIDDKLNQMRNNIRALIDTKMQKVSKKYIRGTFSREIALENDYLNFFAPGDEIYDCITNNALHSYRGTCCAFGFKKTGEFKNMFNWRGFIFIWNIGIDEKEIYNQQINHHIIDKYKGYIPLEQIISPISINGDAHDENEVIKQFKIILNLNQDAIWQETYSKNKESSFKIIHFGKRSGGIIDDFKRNFPKNKWLSLVNNSHEESYKYVKSKIVNIKNKYFDDLRNKLKGNIYSEKFKSNFYNDGDTNYEVTKDISNKVYKVLTNLKPTLDSVCYLEIYE